MTTNGRTYPINLTDDMLMLLLRGGTVNYVVDGIQIRLQQEQGLVIIKKEDYRDLKRHRGDPYVLEKIFEEIDK